MEEKIFDEGFFKKLNTLKLSLNMRLNQGMSGARKSRAKGSSVEFSDFREYTLGDDIRRIDWNAYGRMERFFIKQYMEEKEGVYRVFIDTSKSMDYGEKKKSVMALRIAGAVSYMALNNLDRVYINEIKEYALTEGKGMSGRNAYKNILSSLLSIEFTGKTTLNESIMARDIKSSGCSIIISDFFDHEGIEDMIKYLKYKKQQIVLIEVLSREELKVMSEGCLNLIDSETGENVRVAINRSAIDSYAHSLDNFHKKISTLAKKYDAKYIQAASDEPVEKVVFELVN